MALLSRPRFHALMMVQGMGVLIVLAGMFCYWIGVDGATLPQTITWRVIAIEAVIVISMAIPYLMNSVLGIVRGISRNKVEDKEPVADNPKKVRFLLWLYIYTDLFLLTYLVHITGGLSGSMFTGVYLMLPSIAILLRLDPSDAQGTVWVVVSCMIGIAASFNMSRFHVFEFNAADCENCKKAFEISLALVTVMALTIPLLEIIILRFQDEKTGVEQNENTPEGV